MAPRWLSMLVLSLLSSSSFRSSPLALAGDPSTIVGVEYIREVSHEDVGGGTRRCQIGPLGWMCTPNDTPIVEVARREWPAESNFVYELQEECCTPACVTERFEAARADILRREAPSHEIFVDRKRGADTYGVGGEGGRDKPFATLSRAHHFIDRLRFDVDANNRGDYLLPRPVQLWVKDDNPLSSRDAYHGTLIAQ